MAEQKNEPDGAASAEEKKSRRAHGEGGLYQRASDNRWVGVVDLGWIDGKRRRRTVYGRTQKEARGKMNALREAAGKGQDLAAKPQTVAEWLSYWLDEIKGHDGTRPSTLSRYRYAIDGHIVPVLGKIRLDKLSPADVRRLHAARRDSMKPASLAKIHAVLRVALADAERMDLVSRNVAKSVQPPKLGDSDPRDLAVEDARRFLEVAAGDRLEALFVVALTMGLRRGELLGLRWDDVDLDAATLRVVRSAQRVSGTLRLVDTKTRGSRRPVPIPAMTLEALKRHRKRQDQERADAGKAWKENGLVFASTVGTLIEPRNVTRRVQQLRGRVNLPTLRLHDFRHACASFLLAAGIEPRTVMEILGHATMRMTMERYGHALPERLRAASDAMDKLMGQRLP
ncbi:tyrosine-type recombinase/integrase [Pseudofrankia inefficax]|uniref:Integrase family protein n=1 Tax=Pseudofrankia inefficax (strain DSM 45817 / CECT 9037 / DDB 130130 / EuI1c) TaxID=298654 RepID=E3J277_PSEI1|nr:site-specific integrase [Pseudofrankia inefficax]ADP78115.1 integrase family protein [Pseudofrankia inefficax]